MSESVLVLSIGLSGYDRIFKRCVDSQRAYCRAHGYAYEIVTRVPGGATPPESSWLKVPLMLEALARGYEWVAFLDSDCEVRPHTPPVPTIYQPGRSVYLAVGKSGRFNAGVIIVRNTPESRAYLERVLAHAEQEVPAEDQAPYENGHVIHFARGNDAVGTLDRTWNNNVELVPSDFVQHFSGGPLRPLYRTDPAGRLILAMHRVRNAVQRRLGMAPPVSTVRRERLREKARACAARSPVFARGPAAA
jgi:hypothetical protein